MNIKNIRTALAFVAVVIGFPGLVNANPYPERPVRIVVPFGTGAPDTVARMVAQQLSVQMKQPFVVENRPGANGIVGSEAVARAVPDGYTLMVISAAFTINPSVYKKLPFDTKRDFVPVSQLFSTEALILAVRPTLPVNSVAELIKLAKQPDSRLSYGTPGVGNSLHLVGELFNQRAGTNIVAVPYKGLGPAMNDLISGQIDIMFLTPPLAVPHIRAGKLKALAYTHPTRASFLPDVPTMAESGLSGMEYNGGWYGLVAPAGTPKEVIERLNKEISTALANPAIVHQAEKLNMTPVGSTAVEFGAFMKSQFGKFEEIARKANIQVD